MVLEKIKSPLILKTVSKPNLSSQDVLIKIETCGVCRTDIHIADGELPHPKLPLIMGHQIVGRVEEIGSHVSKHKIGDKVGAPWLGWTCGVCEYCLSGRENLCDQAIFTGYLKDGGFAEYAAVHEDYLLNMPHVYDSLHMAPLLCAGLIGFRSFRLASPNKSIGFYGFGSSAHILIQVASKLGHEVYAFTRPQDTETQDFARSLGAKWAGGSDEKPPVPLDAAIIFAPVGALYPEALKAVKKGGKVISAGIHMSDIPSFPYHLLWEERSMSSVANLTRQDGIDFIEIIKKIPLDVSVTAFPLEEANSALDSIRHGKIEGSAVLII